MPKKRYNDEELQARALELRMKGFSYREIARELGCSVFKVYQVLRGVSKEPMVELEKRVEELSGRLSELVGELNSKTSEIEVFNKRLSSIEEVMQLLLVMARVKRGNCANYRSDGYCNYWAWPEKPEGWDVKEEIVDVFGGRKVYRLNVSKYPAFCVACPAYKAS